MDKVFQAIKEHNELKAIELVHDTLDINTKDSNNNYLINYAVSFNYHKLLVIILHKHAKLDCIDGEGKSILYAPIKFNMIEILKTLCEFEYFGIPIYDIIDNDGNTPLMYCCKFNNYMAFETIMTYKPNLLLINLQNNNCLNVALFYKREKIALFLLEKFSYLLLQVNLYENTALHIIIQNNLIKCIPYCRLIVNNYNSSMDTALHYSISLHSLKATIELLKIGANPNIQNFYGKTAIHLILDDEYLLNKKAYIDILIEKTNLDIYDSNGKTVAKYLFEENYPLDNYKYNPSLCDKSGKSINSILNKPDKKYNIKTIHLTSNNDPIWSGTMLDTFFGLYLIRNHIDVQLYHDNIITNINLQKVFNEQGINNHVVIFTPSNISMQWIFDTFITIQDHIINTNKRFSCITLGLQNKNGGHTNILIIDHKLREIERYEPHGNNKFINNKFNCSYLDKYISQYLVNILPNYTYFSPDKYLPTIGLQILEATDIEQQRLSDTDGFCMAWCLFWALHRALNPQINRENLTTYITQSTWRKKLYLKNIIRSFCVKITKERDKFLRSINMNINDIIYKNISDKQMTIINNALVNYIR
uniref:Ankyrin repeat containing protein n=1 Tax=Megaviridae environmental sample TaxID=1737588 RepID=A0A5J6VII9_9VIRU|nr:MAG: ankyrin repeat containing protein [Megaviridae environmental sample]